MLWAMPAFIMLLFCLNYGRRSLKDGKITNGKIYPINTNNHRN